MLAVCVDSELVRSAGQVLSEPPPYVVRIEDRPNPPSSTGSMASSVTFYSRPSLSNVSAAGGNDPVAQFVIDRGLTSLRDQALGLAHRLFQHSRQIELTVEHDPEEEVSWLQLNAVVVGTPEKVAAARSCFRAELARVLPYADRSQIRLCLDVRGE